MTTERPDAAGLSDAKRALLQELLKGKAAAATPAIPRRCPGADAPLSFAQQRLWFIHQLDPSSPAYNVPTALRLRGALDVGVLRRCLTEILRRHESLRTRFVSAGDRPAQVIDPPAAADLPVVDLESLPPAERDAAAERAAAAEAGAPFDLERGPMLRARLLRLAPEDHVFLVTMHHVAADGWSTGVFVREVGELYGAFAQGRESPLPELPLQYADFALWERGTISGDRLEEGLAHWRRRLSPPAPPLDLPADCPRPPEQTFRGGVETVAIPADVAEPLRRLARAEGATLFMVLLAALDALLSRLTGGTDVVVGTGVANRARPELEPLIGFFVNSLPLRVSCAGDPSFRELLARARETTLAAFAHQDIPFERLVEELQPARDLGRNPLFQVLLELQNAPLDDFELPGISVSPVASSNSTTKFDLELHLWEGAHGTIDGLMTYRADLFDASTARRIVERWAKVLAQVAADPGRRLSGLEITTETDVAATRAGEQGPALTVPPGTVVDRFEEQAARTPEAIAVDDGVRRLTYGELDARAGRIAARLRRAGVGPEARVAVLAHRSLEQVTAVVAVAKARAAWVPLDPVNPDDRLAAMLDGAGAELVLVDEACSRRLGEERTGLLIDGAEDDGAEPSFAPPARGVPEGLSHVIFTSGSTGEPKGVELTHGNLASFTAWHRRAADLGPADRIPLIAGVGFDASVWDIWPSLASGACLLVPDEITRLDPVALRDWLVEREATVAFLPTPLAELVVPLEWPRRTALRILLTGGDRLHAIPVAHAPFRLVNGYGPTETTIVVTSGDFDSGASLPLPTLGRPIANARILVLDARLRPVPPGVTGELWIGGPQVGRGYAGRPDLTAERFLPDPSSPEPGARMYRTGDRARRLEDGRLEFLGRVDDQVKIRGQRVEPGEARAALSACPRVESATVVARELRGETALVAYVVPRPPSAPEEVVPELRAWMLARLPEALVPSAFVLLDAMPFTPNGKIDKRALPDPAPPDRTGPRARPRTPTEKRIAAIWSAVIGVEDVSVDDDFFALGGHSLLATQVLSRLRSELGAELPLRAVFDASTLRALAAEVDRRAPEAAPDAAVPIPARGRRRAPLSLAQQRLWFLDRFEPGAAAYHIPNALRLDGALNVEALARALTEIVARHEALRTRFPETEEGAEQEIVPPFPIALAVENVPGETPEGRRAEAARLVAEEAAAPFDLRSGPVLRARLFRLEPREHVLSLVVHHIVADGWSMGLLVRELGALYEAHVSGREAGLPPLPIQYPDWAVWQREWLDRGELDRQLSFWRGALEDVPPLVLPTDRPRPPVPSYRGDALDLELDEPVVTRLGLLARERGATLHMALLSAFAAVLARWSGQDDFAVGTPVAGRSRQEIEPLVGFFVNTLAVRVRMDGRTGTYAGLLAALRETTLAAHANQDVPFERIVEEVGPERDPSRNPLFQVVFALQNLPFGELRLPGVSIGAFDLATRTAQFDLELSLFETDGRITGKLQWATDLFDRGTMERLAGDFTGFVAAAAEDPDVAVVVPGRTTAGPTGSRGAGGEVPARSGTAPRTPEEEIACGLFADALGLENVGPADDFFELGGHSLLAVRLLARAGAAFRAEIPLRALFAAPTPAGLARAAAGARRSGRAPVGGIRRADASERRKLSFAQRRLWFLDRLDPDSAAYNLASALRLTGELDPGALERALTELERRHESLRARFLSGPDGPEQVFDEPRPRPLAFADLRAPRAEGPRLGDRLAAEAALPFDLERGPLWRARLFRTGEREHVLLLVFHHIVTDGWSNEIFERELAALYDAFADGRDSPLPEPLLQYADWSAWQRAWLEAGELERQLAWWERELEGATPLALPTDRPRAARRGLRGDVADVALADEDAAALARLAREEGATLFHALLAAFQALLARFCGARDVTVGTPVANRSAPEAEGLVGFFANTLALRTDVDPRRSFRELLGTVREKTLDAQANQDVPFEVVVDALRPERDLSRNPLFDAMFALRHDAPPPAEPGRLSVEAFAVDPGAAAFDVTLMLREAEGRVAGALHYDTDLFEAGTAARLTDSFAVLVREAVRRPDARLADLDLRTADERAVVDATNDTALPLPDRMLPELIAERARVAPDDPAVVDENEELTYSELARRAEGIARRLRTAGVGRETAVGLLAGRNGNAVAGMLGIWRAGGTYVPLDPVQPRERAVSMLRDAGVRVVLAERDLEGALPDPEIPVVPLDPPGADEAGPDDGPGPADRIHPRQAAYVVFTSGSTGEPKGSVVEHLALTARSLATAAAQRLEPGARSLCFFPLAWDGSLHEMLPALAVGATVVLHPDPRGDTPQDFFRRCERHGIGVAFCPVGFLHELADDLARSGGSTPSALFHLSTGGDAPRPADVAGILRAARPGLTVTNIYGPTEAVIVATGENVTREDAERGRLPIGRPFAHATAHLLDEVLRPVPIGAVGEIFLGGPVLARGYAARPEQTAAAFVPDPFSPEPGARMYRTGDLARRLDDGRIVFVGRRDGQLKIRGFRVELGEVEHALLRVPGVAEGAVIAERKGAEARLVAYFVPAGGEGPDPDAVRAALRERLPDYMLPAVAVRLDALPRTRTGKLDRRALPAPETARPRGVRSGPRRETERALAPLWKDTLGLPDVDVDESFFEAGGNSLLAIRLIAAVRRELGVELPVAAIFRDPTLAGLARRIDAGDAHDARDGHEVALVTIRPGAGGPTLVCLPAVGGGVSDFAELADALPPAWEVRAIPVLEEAPAAGGIEATASACAEAINAALPDGPVHLLGWSYGAHVAFETARRLEAAGRTVGALALVDAPAAGQSDEAPGDFALPPDLALPADLPAGDAARWLAGVAVRRDAVARYRPAPWSGDAVVVRGTESPAGHGRDASLGWSRLVRGRLDLEWAPGSHDSLLSGDGAHAVAAAVERHAAAADRRKTP